MCVYVLLSAGTLQSFSEEATFIARSVSSPAGETHIETVELLYPPALLNLCSTAQFCSALSSTHSPAERSVIVAV